MRIRIMSAVLALGGVAGAAHAATVSEVCGTWRFSTATVDALTAALTAVPPDMPADQVTVVSDALRSRLGQMRWTVSATQTSLVLPDFPAQSVAVTITPVDATTFTVASVDAATGTPRTLSLRWIDATHLEVGNLLSTIAGPVQPATKLPDAVALERVTP